MLKRGLELTAYCGLYCGDCLRYRSKVGDLASNLLREIQRPEFQKYAEAKSCLVKEFEHYSACCQFLEAVEEMKCSSPCRSGGCPDFHCNIRICCQKKGLKGCWECAFEKCGELEFLKPFHGDAPLKNLRVISKLGVDEWTEHRNKFYTWL